MSLLKEIWDAIPCWWHDGQLDIQPGLIRLRCAKCGRVTDGVQVPTLEEWQQVHRAILS